MIVVDANILLYAHHPESRQHERARVWLEDALGGAETIGFAWGVVGAFLRIATNRHAVDPPLAIEQAIGAVDEWFASPAAVPVAPGPEHWAIFRKLLASGRAAGNLVPDAHLAALAIEYGATLLSADHGFARFPNLDFTPW